MKTIKPILIVAAILLACPFAQAKPAQQTQAAPVIVAKELTMIPQVVDAQPQGSPNLADTPEGTVPESMKIPENDCGFPKPPEDAATAAIPPGTDQAGPPPNGAPVPQDNPPPAPQVVRKTAQLDAGPHHEKTCAQEQVTISLDADFFGHRIGDKIPVTLTMLGRGHVDFDMASFELVPTKSRFEMASLPQDHVQKTDEGVQHRVVFWVQSFDEHPTLTLQVAARYATRFAPDGAPLWQDIVSPEFLFLKSNTTFPGFVLGLLRTSLSPATTRYSWAIMPSFVIGLTLVIGVFVFLGLRLINRVRPRQSVSPTVRAWLGLDELIRSGNKMGFTSKHYEGISANLKIYLTAAYPQLQPHTPEAAAALPAKDSKRDAIAAALTKLRGVVYLGKDLTAAQHKELVQELRKIVDRPWTA